MRAVQPCRLQDAACCSTSSKTQLTTSIKAAGTVWTRSSAAVSCRRKCYHHCSSIGGKTRLACMNVQLNLCCFAAQCVCMSTATQKVSDLPASLQKIVGAFQMVPDPMARYKQLLFYAAKLPVMPAEQHQPENKVEGCVSQVWVLPELRDDGKVYWTADSDSQLTKGLAALLVLGLSGCSPAEILSLQPGFIEMLGLKQSLTPSRNNGFLNMFLKMQKLTLGLVSSKSGSS
eukprot:GHRQ01014093.1.p1 GENE.GHRQ01014093.1~~GHRQ01014093.1.p1  ORF type:complete len:231 (+),score=68.22 GHRQ01014093.1:345-1037(+)